MCRAYALGVYSTDATLAELLAMANTVTDQTLDDMVVRIVEAEGVMAKFTI